MIGELIEKEEINAHEFIPADEQLSEEMLAKLSYAQRLGNEFKSKAYIAFNTKQGIKKVSTTVWSVTEKYLQLKNNVHVPINSIVDIDF
ncbi:hypothetical protein [Pedobacter sp. UBA4863]|uniref:hypothetical protein n=1 Tax=Pedobacter sp. UBA4863 TaxID=1947060 RepID=UPI0025D550EE|nr:hypothetical protein [Pedobacter sp. UBA4863]